MKLFENFRNNSTDKIGDIREKNVKGVTAAVATVLLMFITVAGASSYYLMQERLTEDIEETEFPEEFSMEIESCYIRDGDPAVRVRNQEMNQDVNVSGLNLYVEGNPKERNISEEIVGPGGYFDINFSEEDLDGKTVKLAGINREESKICNIEGAKSGTGSPISNFNISACVDWWSGDSEPYRIEDVRDLQCMSGDQSADYELTKDIDASYTKNWRCGGGDCTGFVPIGQINKSALSSNASELGNSTHFSGSLDGNGHQITRLYTNLTGKNIGNNGGIFSGIRDNATIQNIQMRHFYVESEKDAGSLLGSTGYRFYIKDVLVDNTTVISKERSGGLAGNLRTLWVGVHALTENVVVKNSKIKSVQDKGAGGLTGNLRSSIRSVAVVNSDITSERWVGGVIGYNDDSSGYDVRNVYSLSNNITSTGYVAGGIAGYLEGVKMYNGYSASNSINGDTGGGAILGNVFSGGELYDVYWSEELSNVGEPINSKNIPPSNSFDTNVTEPGFNLTQNEITGNDADSNMDQLDWVDVWETTNTFPELQSANR